ncbi:MAG TPA: dihydrodipicolinate synthase family protein [Bacteroidota bacterium]|jgi:4-hydroxy-tetrahydrodipicolinate synthase|nr:dihydrodipicolinate synthase family protein [Bacteroidota bacterium]
MTFSGVFSVLPTPFTSGGELDLQSLGRVIELYIRSGVNGLTALGVTSETARLSDAEKSTVLETVTRQVNKRVPVIVGTSTDGLHTSIELSLKAKDLGASAVMVSPPRMPKLNSEAIVNHYRRLSAAIDLPIVIQDYPPVSGFTMEPALLATIASEVPAARTIKLEDPPTPLKIARVLELSDGVPLSVLGGLGGTYLLEELLSGASGSMTGFAVPELLVKVVRLFGSGDRDQAADLFYRTVALMRFEFQESVGLAIRKEILRHRGAMTSSFVRSPGVQMDVLTRSALDSLLKWFLDQNSEIGWILD